MPAHHGGPPGFFQLKVGLLCSASPLVCLFSFKSSSPARCPTFMFRTCLSCCTVSSRKAGIKFILFLVASPVPAHSRHERNIGWRNKVSHYKSFETDAIILYKSGNQAQREEVTCLRSHSERRTSWHSNSLWDQWANILLILTLTHSFLRIAFGHLFFFQVNTYCGITEMQERVPKCVVNEFSQQNTPMEPTLSSRNKRGYMYTMWSSLH